MNVKIFSLLALCLSLLACVESSAPPEKPPLPERSNAEVKADSERAVTQVRQTLNLTAQQAFRAAVAALQKRGVRVVTANEEHLVLETVWVGVKDKLCGNTRMEGAPLDCRVRIAIKVEPLRPAASALHARYEELCSLNGDTPLICSGSAGEKLMISVVEEVAATP